MKRKQFKAEPVKPYTYEDLFEALSELSEDQLEKPVMVAKGRKVFPVWDTSLSCECNGGLAVELVGPEYPLLICTKPDRA